MLKNKGKGGKATRTTTLFWMMMTMNRMRRTGSGIITALRTEPAGLFAWRNMELIIAEKPSVGKAIAAAIGATESKNGYMEGHGFMVTWCLGHLVELAMPED